MVTIKNKGTKPKLQTPARTITSVIVPFREKNRPPQLAHQEFANRPITICLYPNYRCSIDELPEVSLRLNKIWREITNHDIRYQQKRGNIPSFLGIRDLCVKTSYSGIRLDSLTYNDLVLYDCYPYLRITLDNIRVAVFIIRNWCARTAQYAHEYSVCEYINGKLTTSNFDLYKSNPYYFEQLAKLKNIHSIAFGGSAELLFYDVDRRQDFYNIPGVRCSTKFGTTLNTYSIRRIMQIQEEKQTGELERARILRARGANLFDARLKWNKVKHFLYATASADSYYGRRAYAWNKSSHYAGEMGHYLNCVVSHDCSRTEFELARLHAPELLQKIVGADDLIKEHRKLEAIAVEEYKRRCDAEEEVERLRKGEPKYVYFGEKEKCLRSKKALRDYVKDEFSLLSQSECSETIKARYTKEQVGQAVAIISECAKVEVDPKTGQISLKF